MYPDPFTVRMIHHEMVNEALERHGPDHLLREREPFLRSRQLPGMRHAAARTLRRLADRIDSAPLAGQMGRLCAPGIRGVRVTCL